MKRKPIVEKDNITENEKINAEINDKFYYKYIISLEHSKNDKSPSDKDSSKLDYQNPASSASSPSSSSTTEKSNESTKYELHHAVHSRDYTNLKKLLISNKSIVNSVDDDNWSALHVASCRCDKEAVELLLEFNADPKIKSKTGRSPLYFAVRNDCIDLVKLLVEKGGDVNEFVLDYNLKKYTTYLHYAVEINNIEMVRTLLEYGANVNERDWQGNTALHSAVNYQGQSVIELLLDHGANASEAGQFGRTALHLAVNNENLITTDLLLQRGAEIDHQDESGLGALHLAIERRTADLVELLLTSGANPNLATNNGQSPLHYACGPVTFKISKTELERRSREVMDVILTAGPNLELRDSRGLTPAVAAVYERKVDLLGRLLEYQADVGTGEAFRLALERNSYSCLWLILDHDGEGWNPERLLDQTSFKEEPVLPGIVRHWYRRYVAGLPVNKRLLARLKDGELWRGIEGSDFQKRCLEELEELDGTWSQEGVIGGIELLCASRRRLVDLAGKPDVRENMQSLKEHCNRICKRKWTIYYGLLERKLGMALRLEPLMGEAIRCLDLACGHLLPNAVLIRIIDYLNVCDVGNLAKMKTGALEK